MEFRNFTIQDQQGNVLPGASISVYEVGTTTPTSVFDENDVALSQPLTPSSLGIVGFAAANGVYDVVVTNGPAVVRYENEKFLDVAEEVQTVTDAIDGATTLELREVTASAALVLTDALSGVAVTSASATTVTVPANSSVAFEVGAQVMVLNDGAGAVTIQGDAGVTVNTADGMDIQQYRIGYLLYRGGDVWILSGGVS